LFTGFHRGLRGGGGGNYKKCTQGKLDTRTGPSDRSGVERQGIRREVPLSTLYKHKKQGPPFEAARTAVPGGSLRRRYWKKGQKV